MNSAGERIALFGSWNGAAVVPRLQAAVHQRASMHKSLLNNVSMGVPGLDSGLLDGLEWDVLLLERRAGLGEVDRLAVNELEPPGAYCLISD